MIVIIIAHGDLTVGNKALSNCLTGVGSPRSSRGAQEQLISLI